MDFQHSFEVASSRSALPLRATVTATFDGGKIERWGLEVQRCQLSVSNRDTFVRLLRGVRREEVTGDGIGARWETPERLAIWDQHRHWTLTPKQAKAFDEAILLAIGRFADQAKPGTTPQAEPKAANDDWRDRRIAELEQRVKELEGYVAFLRQQARQ